MCIRRAVLQFQALAEMGSDQGGMVALDRGGNGGFRPATMASSD